MGTTLSSARRVGHRPERRQPQGCGHLEPGAFPGWVHPGDQGRGVAWCVPGCPDPAASPGVSPDDPALLRGPARPRMTRPCCVARRVPPLPRPRCLPRRAPSRDSRTNRMRERTGRSGRIGRAERTRRAERANRTSRAEGPGGAGQRAVGGSARCRVAHAVSAATAASAATVSRAVRSENQSARKPMATGPSRTPP